MLPWHRTTDSFERPSIRSALPGLLLAAPELTRRRLPPFACAQRHGDKVNHLGRPADQRKALLRGLTTELIRHGRIRSTLAHVKAVRKTVSMHICRDT